MNGSNGVSPTVSITEGTNQRTITVTDVNGTKSTTVKDGEKGDKGDKGDKGATGNTGAKGSDASVTRTNIINALGYTPSNSGLTQSEVEQMIADNKQDNISIVNLPFLKTQVGGNYNTTVEGITTFQMKSNSSGKFTWTTPNGSTGSFDTGKNQVIGAGLTINSSRNNIGFHLAATEDSIWVKLKGKTSYTQTSSTPSMDAASDWTALIDKYGVVNNSSSVICLNVKDGSAWNSDNWSNWDFSDFNQFSGGMTSFFLRCPDINKQYFALLIKYGNGNFLARAKYTTYQDSYFNEGRGVLVLFPYDADDDGIWVLGLKNWKPSWIKKVTFS